MAKPLLHRLKGIKVDLQSLKEGYSTDAPPTVTFFNNFVKKITLLTKTKLISAPTITKKLRACIVKYRPIERWEITKLINALELTINYISTHEARKVNLVQIPKKVIPSKNYATKDITSDFLENNKVFIVHGHNDGMKQAVARVILQLGLEAIILHEQANQGKTVIEKFESHSDVGFAIVLVSPDDIGYSKKDGSEKAKDRARQNVVFELGFFYGRLGRNRVSTLVEKSGNFELHSDIEGIAYTLYDGSEGKWRFDIAKELKKCGYGVDSNQLL